MEMVIAIIGILVWIIMVAISTIRLLKKEMCNHKRKSLNFCSDCGAKVSVPTIVTIDLYGENKELYDTDPAKYPIGTIHRIGWSNDTWIFRRIVIDKDNWYWWQYQCPYCFAVLTPGPRGGASTNQVCAKCRVNFGCLVGAPD